MTHSSPGGALFLGSLQFQLSKMAKRMAIARIQMKLDVGMLSRGMLCHSVL